MDLSQVQNSIRSVDQEVSKVIVGQRTLIDRILIALLCDGHILLEGLPGLAKTLTIKTISDSIKTVFHRIQFTPDLLPSDLIGTMIYNPNDHEFTPKKGPIFANIVLADEINRAPAKVQSALLEAMGEKQVTIGDTTFGLNDPFIVLATQNPLEQEGTYPLPEAQLDRFMMKVLVEYPTLEEESEILDRLGAGQNIEIKPVIEPKEILLARNFVNEIYMDEKVKTYILNLIQASRYPKEYKLRSLEGMISIGGSPRATIALSRASRARAFLDGRTFVTPDDVKDIAHDVLRHRIIRTFEAEASEMSCEAIIDQLLSGVEVP